MSAAPPFVLVFGGSGFIGSRVVRQLVAAIPKNSPWRSVKVLTRSPTSAARVSALGAEAIAGDLLGADDWRACAAEARYIVHCAQPAFTEDPDQRFAMDWAVLGALDPSLLARAVLVYGSSYYGTSAAPMNEQSPRHPIGLGASFEPCLQALAQLQQSGLDAVAAMVGGVYGRGSWFLEMYLAALTEGQAIPLCEPTPIWPYIHIDDCARAIVHLLTVDGSLLDAEGREVILVDDEPIPMDRFITLLGQATGQTPVIQRLDEASLQAMLPPLLAAYMTANMPHSNARLRRLGFALDYPHVREGLTALLRDL